MNARKSFTGGLSRRNILAFAALSCGMAVTRAASAGFDLPVFTVKPFSLQPVAGLDGIEAPSLDMLKGHVSVLNFWGSWCPACRNEHGLLLKLRDRGLRIIGINARDTDEKAVKYLREAGNPYQFVGKDETKGGLTEMLGVNSFPQTFVVGPQADVIWQSTGTLNELELDDIMKVVADAKARQG